MGYPIVETTRSVEPTERTEEIMSALEDGRIWTGECVVQRKDGTSFTAMVTETPVLDEEGALVAVVGISMDITELNKPGGATLAHRGRALLLPRRLHRHNVSAKPRRRAHDLRLDR
jgi:hypothetical protein